jgi:hypothetical protein
MKLPPGQSAEPIRNISSKQANVSYPIRERTASAIDKKTRSGETIRFSEASDFEDGSTICLMQ